MSKIERDYDRAMAKRENLFRRIQFCYESGVALEDDPQDQVKLKNFMIRYGTLDKTAQDYRQIVQEIVSLKQQLEPTVAPSFQFLESFEDLNDHIQYVASRYIPRSVPGEYVPPVSKDGEKSKTRIHMPTLELMKFSGEDLTVWPIWYENYKQLVHCKSEFSDAEKLQYLLSSLTSRALKICTAVDPTPNNYSTIFALLEDMYHDKRYLANTYLDRLFNFRALPNNTSNHLQIFLEKFNTNVNALKRLNLNDLADYMLTYLAMSKLPSETISAFELIRMSSELPKYEEVIDFVKKQSKTVPKQEKPRSSSFNHNPSNVNFPKNTKTFVSNSFSVPNKNCVFCQKGPHLLKDCQPFKLSNYDSKLKFIKENRMCFNCFSKKHGVSNCQSKFKCLICKKRHHTQLHREDTAGNRNLNIPTNAVPEKGLMSNIDQNKNITTLCSHTVLPNNSSKVILLSTAVVKVLDKWGKEHLLRFLIDNASMSNLLMFNVCKKLGLSYTEFSSNVVGIGGSVKPIKGRTSLTIYSNLNQNLKFQIEVLLIDQVTNFLPDVPVDTSTLDNIKCLPLADPTYHLPGRIDGILGAELYAEILGSHKIVSNPGNPTAVQTALGYIIIGPSPPLATTNQNKSYRTFVTLESLVEKMFELENYSEKPELLNEDKICENIYNQTYKRNSAGRYTVSLPFKDDPAKLGNSFDLARKRLLSLERRLDNTPNLRITYSKIIEDYLNQGHMTLVNANKLCLPSYYAAHHCVWKPDSSSTPCRIVFDFSMKCDNGVSLNDILYKGPKLQNNIFTILTNFRLFPICMGADIKAMYRQINVDESQRQYQRILWRFHSQDPIQVYELNTVTFGVSSSPFLSLRTIKQLIQDESDNFPIVKEYVSRDIFMDDLICSVPNVEFAKMLHEQTVHFFQKGGFQIVKWISNSLDVLAHIRKEIQSPAIIEFDKGQFKILGLQYNPSSDEFSFKITDKITGPCTKRNLLSILSRTFDPLGFLAPLTLFLKLLIKELWELKCEWDELAPENIAKKWLKLNEQFSELNNIKIPRHVLIFENIKFNIIGFSDASSLGFASVVYIRAIDASGSITVSFLCAQSRVAPMSQITLPRLELCAATQLAKLIAHIRETYSNRITIDSIYAFSDSMITLNWIHSNPKKWKTFISNRVAKIQSCLPPLYWFYVPTKENPADCASRGLLPSALTKHKMWFSGPDWLKLPISKWPMKSLQNSSDSEEWNQEVKVNVVTKEVVSPLYNLIEYFSSWSKLCRSTVYVLRFAKILPIRMHISNLDLEKAEYCLIRAVQEKHFQAELKLLHQNKPVRKDLRRLNPILKDDIIRVGGRLDKAQISFDQKHPILLPKSDPLTYLIIKFYHKLYGHPGAYLLHSILAQKFWILSARRCIRKCTWECNICFRNNPKSTAPFMADLPEQRVNQAKAFFNTGVDYTGSFQITIGRRRGCKSQKAYICLFTCLATRAIHLELAADLSTESFLSALKRFLSRRGNCNTIFSDNATNFVGAKRKLDELYQFTESTAFKEAFQIELNLQKINWKFNPASAPHFGGCWESQIKSVKTHLHRIIGNQILTYEELYTVLCQVETLLNSRPLTVLSSDPNDLSVLTPAHFLYSTPLGALPAADVTSTPLNRLDRFKLLDAMVQHFWNRWNREYLITLQTRQKWNSPVNPPKIGTVVVLMQENLPPLQWPLAVITELLPGPDEVVRVVRIKCRGNTYVRPVVKLCPLPSQ